MPEPEVTPPARRSTHVDTGIDDAGTALVAGSEAPSRSSRRTRKTASLPAFTGASSTARATASTAPAPTAAPASASAPSEPANTEPDTDPAPRRSRRPALILLTATIVFLLGALGAVGTAIVANLAPGGATAAMSDADENVPSTLATPLFPLDTPAAAAGATPCTTVHVLASFENTEMVEKLAEGYNAAPRDIDGSCVTVTTAKDKSGAAATRAAGSFADVPADQRPTIWLPDSATWLSVANDEGATVVPAEGTEVASTGIVLAMPAPLAFATGWYNEAPTWTEVFSLANRPDFWSVLGHPEWGAFKLGKTSPLVATSGEAALLASFGASGSGVGASTAAEFGDTAVLDQVRMHELATSHYLSTPEHFLWHARQAEESGASSDFLSAVIVDEKSVWDYNRGMISHDGITRVKGDVPHDELVAIYPTDGVYVAESTAVVLDGEWVDEQERSAAADFLRFAHTAEGQKIVTDAGYRDLDGRLAPVVKDVGVLPRRVPNPIDLPSGEVVTALHDSFSSVRKRAAVLFLIDTSGSMNNAIPSGHTKIEAAKSAITAALGHFTDGDLVGLAAFSSSGGAEVTPGMLTPVADIASNRDALLSGVKSLRADAYTPLHSAVSEFTRARSDEHVADHINAVIVLSDGADETLVPTITEAEMLDDLTGLPRDAAVKVFTLAYGSSADVDTLQQIASATGAQFYDATDPTEVTAILGDLVTSF
ncbi:substrate-binding domain-containing protein [Microbacterium esteraromaticum]|uniref:substrate-binding domain-containing protein n=1 Tax=Microbacterium esteraromaticum TaxID=57043 RepID=UPI003C305FDF